MFVYLFECDPYVCACAMCERIYEREFYARKLVFQCEFVCSHIRDLYL